jgi:hypothetical protein
MAEANMAYQARDFEALRILFETEQARPGNFTGDEIGARLIRAIRQVSQVRARIAEIDAAIRGVRTTDAWRLLSRVESEGEQVLDQLEHDLHEQVRVLERRLSRLRSSS